MSSSHDDARSNEGCSTDVKVLVAVNLEHGAHVRPLAELCGCLVGVVLDPHANAADVSRPALRHVRLGLGLDRVCEVRVATTHLQIAFALGVLGIERNVLAKVASDIDETWTSVRDDLACGSIKSETSDFSSAENEHCVLANVPSSSHW